MPKPPIEVRPLVGTNGADILFATHAAYLSGDFPSGIVNGLDGDDVIVRDRTGAYWREGDSHGDVSVTGESGADTVSYASADHAVSVNLAQGVAHLDAVLAGGATYGTDFLDTIERVVGTVFDDHIIGDAGVNRLWAHDGDDDIWGEAGNDELWACRVTT